MSDSHNIPEDEKRAFDKLLSEFTGGKMHIEDTLKSSERDIEFINKLVDNVIIGLATHLHNNYNEKIRLRGKIVRPPDLMEDVNTYMRIFLFELMRRWNGVNMLMTEDKTRRDLGLGPREG